MYKYYATRKKVALARRESPVPLVKPLERLL